MKVDNDRRRRRVFANGQRNVFQAATSENRGAPNDTVGAHSDEFRMFRREHSVRHIKVKYKINENSRKLTLLFQLYKYTITLFSQMA